MLTFTDSPRVSTIGLQEAAKSGGGIRFAGLAPVAELGDIDTAICRLAVVDPALGLIQELADGSLRQTRFLPERPEQDGNCLVSP